MKQALIRLEVNEGHLQPFESAFNDAEIITQAMNLRWHERKTAFWSYIGVILTLFVADMAFLGCHLGFLLPNLGFSLSPNCMQRFSQEYHVWLRRFIVMLCLVGNAILSALFSTINLGVQGFILLIFIFILCSDTSKKHKLRKNQKTERLKQRAKEEREDGVENIQTAKHEEVRFIL